ncbi:unnamed protein product [Rotaria socialis]|uniref:Uncharacterized protein n=1 Tax=Rotaria socialis TaxID=392032 RepID=A0A820HVP8_9BILA|nr:unnamed protein product [Rotaria socialis]CAF3401916.1 unnamed protein product [Rotaria socialis]CAF3453198.1 unnamed protein product [Rotaria socialis]CAF3575190.1 unnamed protein product [Rotaria socialis]CAF3718061.1 unnamed protein product [Rotaria socialis]
MDKKPNAANPPRTSRKISPQSLTMGKHIITKRRYSHQSKIFSTQQEPTFFVLEHLNASSRFKHRNNTSFRPLATSTPYEIEQSRSFNSDSPHSFMRNQRPLLTPPICCSTPKQSRRQPNASSSVKRKLPVVISQRRLQFTTNSQSFVQYTKDESRQMTMKNIKIWLL